MSSTHHDEVNRLRPSELSFDTLCSLFEALLKVKGHDKRAKLVRHFMDTCILRKSPNGKGEAYDVFRLILPFLDTERGNYQLKESKLAVAFIEAASIDRRSKEAQAAKHWTNPGQKKDAGNFAEVLQESLFRKNCSVQDTSSIELRKQVTIGDVNAKLDELVAAAGDTKKQAGILRYFMRRCTPTHMKWLTKIILKHLNINISEGRIFKLWHTDALEVFNNSGMSLRKVFNEMTDEDKPWSCDISPGNAVRPQLARAVMSPAAGFKLMSQSEYRNADGQLEFLVESKFDGERIQIHRCKGGKTCYFSRVALDHSVHSSYSVMDGAVGAAAPGHEEFILDGELVVWNKRRQVFEPFGTLKHTVHCAKRGDSPDKILQVEDYSGVVNEDGMETDYSAPRVGDLELTYIAFDVIYMDNLHKEGPVLINKPLHERLEILRTCIATAPPVTVGEGSVTARVVPLIPNETRFGGSLASRMAHTQEEVENAIKAAKRMREEGIVLKRLNSPWHSDDRSGVWLKLKPDYLEGRVDVDCVVLGGWYGEGRRGAGLSQYLMGLVAPKSAQCDGPIQFATFCRVGSGLNDEERQRVDTQLRPILTEVTSTVPPCILATGLEKPDVWVTDPSRSIVFAVGADVRRIATKIYFTGLSLRFPRVHGIRDDKSPSMADKQEDLKDTLEDKWKEAEQIRQEEEAGGVGTRKRRRKAGVGGGGNKRPKVGMLPEHLKLADVSKIEVVSDALKGCFIYVANTDGKDSMTKPQVAAMIKQLGGMEVAQHTYSKITHFVAGNGEGKRVKNLIAADKDVVSLSWLARCRAGLKKEPLRPNDYIHMSAATRAKLSQEGIQGPASAEDVAARLRHMRLADIDLAALMDKLLAVDPELEGHLNDRALPSEATKDSPRAFTPLLDALLARKGLLDARRSLLHGCTMLVVNVDPPAVHAAHDPFHGRLLATGPPLLSMARRVRSADVAAGATVTKLGTRGMALKAGLHGAQVVDAMSPAVTHVVGIQVRSPGGVMPFASHGGSQEERETEEEEATVTADVVLPAVRDQGGGPEGVATLEKAVGEGAVSLVSGEWLQECFDEAEKAKPPGEVPGPQDVFLPDAKAYPLVEGDGGQNPGTWPWRTYAPAPAAPSPPRPSRKSRKAPPGHEPGTIMHVPRRRGRATRITRSQAQTSPEAGHLYPGDGTAGRASARSDGVAEMLVDAKEEAKEEERLKEGKEEENAGEEGGFTGFAGLYDELSRGVQEEAAVEDVVGLLASPGGPAGTSFAAPAPPASVAAAPAVAAAQDMGPLTSFMVSVDATGGEGGAGSGGGGGLAAGGMGGQDGHRSQVFAGGEHGGNERPKLSLKERMQLLGMRKKE